MHPAGVGGARQGELPTFLRFEGKIVEADC